jgi:hypothetical protein
MCPYYLDGDLAILIRAGPVIPVCHPGSSLNAGGSGYYAVFKGRPRGVDVRDRRHGGRRQARGLSKLNSMLRLELGDMPHVREGRGLAAEATRQLARPGSVDILGRTVGSRSVSDHSRPKR